VPLLTSLPEPIQKDANKAFPPAGWIGLGIALGAGLGVIMMALMSRKQPSSFIQMGSPIT